MIQIKTAHTPHHLTKIQTLFQEYAASLDIDLDFQNFGEELANLPGRYAPPRGALSIALWEGQVAGCVGLRDLSQGICEMKRLYTRPPFRGLKIGRAMAESIIQQARDMGYGRMRLDTLASMERARALYASLGFQEIPPYCHNPINDAVFLELVL